jgi:hypothetical protein
VVVEVDDDDRDLDSVLDEEEENKISCCGGGE